MLYLFLLISLLFSPNVAQECPSEISITLTRPPSVLENGQVTFTCTVDIVSGYTQPTEVIWQKDFIALDTTGTDRYKTSTNVVSSSEVRFTLEITRSEVEDSGNYSCDPTIPGVLCRATIDLTVNYALAVIVEDQVSDLS